MEKILKTIRRFLLNFIINTIIKRIDRIVSTEEKNNPNIDKIEKEKWMETRKKFVKLKDEIRNDCL